MHELIIPAHERILILAPHPDDETLATGGVLAAHHARAGPDRLRVIIVTNGEASRLAAWLTLRRPMTSTRLQMLALRRQQETLAAMDTLGIHQTQIEFWGFPDQGISFLWTHRTREDRYRSPHTGFDHTHQVWNAATRPYTGPALAHALWHTLVTFRPTLIFIPHPEDAHADHRALAHFLLWLLARPQASQLPLCRVLAYPMWRPAFPRRRYVRLDKLDPDLDARFPAPGQQWFAFPLAPSLRTRKAAALRHFRTQAMTARGLLRAASRASQEIFALLPD